jgi:hypothetical protein
MTVLVLAEHADELARCAHWLADSDEPLIGLTGSRLPSAEHAGYSRLEQIVGYVGSTAVELAALRIAREAQLSAIVATGFPDLLRAACLREYLGVPGQGRASALACVDLLVLRDTLDRFGVPVVPARPVRRPADLCRHSRTLGLPLRLRHRRAAGWAVTARIAEQDDLLSVLNREPDGRSGSLLAEQDLPGERSRIRLTGPAADLCGQGAHRPSSDPVRDEAGAWTASAVRNALPDSDGLLVAVDTLRSADGRLLVDSLVLADEDDHHLQRSAARAQAGLRDREPVP